MIEIQSGKTYRTRSGDKARIYARSGLVDEESCFYWHGAIKWKGHNGTRYEDYWQFCSWDKSGRASYAGPGEKTESSTDIVEECIDEQ